VLLGEELEEVQELGLRPGDGAGDPGALLGRGEEGAQEEHIQDKALGNRIRDRFDKLWAEANRRLEVTLTSAIELDPKLVENVGAEIERQTKRTVDLRTEVDEGILGGLRLRVGNMVLDASLRSKLERLRKEVAQAA
jgi:hypothetical protein